MSNLINIILTILISINLININMFLIRGNILIQQRRNALRRILRKRAIKKGNYRWRALPVLHYYPVGGTDYVPVYVERLIMHTPITRTVVTVPVVGRTKEQEQCTNPLRREKRLAKKEAARKAAILKQQVVKIKKVKKVYAPNTGVALTPADPNSRRSLNRARAHALALEEAKLINIKGRKEALSRAKKDEWVKLQVLRAAMAQVAQVRAA